MGGGGVLIVGGVDGGFVGWVEGGFVGSSGCHFGGLMVGVGGFWWVTDDVECFGCSLERGSALGVVDRWEELESIPAHRLGTSASSCGASADPGSRVSSFVGWSRVCHATFSPGTGQGSTDNDTVS